MISKNQIFYKTFLIVIIFLCVILIIFQNSNNFTGNYLLNTTSNVSLFKYYSIAFSDNLSSGIEFGTIENLPAVSVNATYNYLGLSNSTEYFINVSNDSNTNIDFCIKADGDLESIASDILGLGNETYNNATFTNLSSPSDTEVLLTTSYVKSGSNVLIGGVNYYRFWLDVPSGQAAGTYNNTVNFKAVETDYSC
ncbi:MAG: hypothetical protein WC812_01300 [Candidatus Pacearchaeota archaeon]|jgi:hypothetical protein